MTYLVRSLALISKVSSVVLVKRSITFLDMISSTRQFTWAWTLRAKIFRSPQIKLEDPYNKFYMKRGIYSSTESYQCCSGGDYERCAEEKGMVVNSLLVRRI